jgi:hypothetical protein
MAVGRGVKSVPRVGKIVARSRIGQYVTLRLSLPFQENDLSRNSFGSWLPVTSFYFLISIFHFPFSSF